MWVLVVRNSSGAEVYVYVFSSQANALVGQAAANASLPIGWTTAVFNTPATDTAWGDTGGLV
jgi:hypothetical protein